MNVNHGPKGFCTGLSLTLLKYIRKVTVNGNRQVTCEVNLYGPSQGKP